MGYPTDAYEILHYNMVRAHATFKLGYENILSRLDDPPMNDLANFLGYCQAWAEAIDNHHHHEEETVFPFLNQKLDFSGEVEQHKFIHAGLDGLLTHIRAARADPATFEAPKMKGMMMDLRDVLYKHLDEEVEHVAAEHMKVFEAGEILACLSRLEKSAKSTGNLTLIAPYMASHTPPEFKAEWPPVPWFIKKILLPYVVAARNRGYWKYSPYSVS